MVWAGEQEGQKLKKNKKNRHGGLTTSPIWGHAPTEPIITKFGVRGLVGDVITGDKFCRDRLRGFWSLWVRKWGSPIDLSCRPYNRSALPCCLWPLRNTRSADDTTFIALSPRKNPYLFSFFPRTITDWNHCHANSAWNHQSTLSVSICTVHQLFNRHSQPWHCSGNGLMHIAGYLPKNEEEPKKVANTYSCLLKTYKHKTINWTLKI